MCAEYINLRTPFVRRVYEGAETDSIFKKPCLQEDLQRTGCFAVTHSAGEKTLSVLFVFYIPELIQPVLLCVVGALKDVVMVPL